jgi:formylglycine-generating enzyme required for sulfatase activity
MNQIIKPNTMKTKGLLKKIFVATSLLFGFASQSNANNVLITGTSVSGSNITFNISWDNSWNTNLAPNNWDAVWVFVKYQDCATRLWAHAGLSTIGSDHTAGSPLQVDPVTDGKGVFIRRSALGGGNVGSTSITLKMTIAAGTFNYKVFGVEMVNVPQGNFDIGDGTGVSTFNSINITAVSQSGGLTAAVIGGASVAIPATFPMGYNSFYSMKYEITQEQYVEFLNALTYDQQKSRTVNDPISAAGTYAMNASYINRNGIRISVPGNNNALPAIYACDATAGVENNANDGQNIVANWLSWGDLTAYLDWSALRPMTEMEYEKICRGPVARVAGEYPWGTTALTQVYSALAGVANPLTATESYAPVSNGMCVYGVNSGAATYGPMRVGIFASGSSGRASAGASYFGAMEMGGNVYERVVNTANASGVAFTGNLGDGILPANGDANQVSWPSPVTAIGAGFRGGDYSNTAAMVRTSDRNDAATTSAVRSYGQGGRGVR